MNIILTGVGYNNKGAELMLRAMVEHLRDVFPESCISTDCTHNFHQCSRYGLYQLALRNRGRIVRLFEWLPEKTRSEWGIIFPQEIDFVLDASGFVFGDQWSERHIRQEGERFLKYKRQYGSKVILLPQAFGPFKNSDIRKISKEILSEMDMIFVRDNSSLNYIKELLPSSMESEKIFFGPDFTNLVRGTLPFSFDEALKGAVAILPNEKMLTKKSTGESEKYISFLVHCIKTLERKKARCFILCHQNEDKNVVDMLNSECDCTPEVVAESNPAHIKGILGLCRFLIGSRFHGLVNGLSQGIPCICTSWSHKYEALFEDYQCSEYLISDLSDTVHVDQLISNLFDDTTYKSIRNNIEKHASSIAVQTKNMWKTIDSFIREDLKP